MKDYYSIVKQWLIDQDREAEMEVIQDYYSEMLAEDILTKYDITLDELQGLVKEVVYFVFDWKKENE